jgi:quaternary ammonium compound-resistance protein SugE
MAWLLVLLTSAFEVAFALSMKASFGFTKLIPSVIAVTIRIASVVILSPSQVIENKEKRLAERVG